MRLLVSALLGSALCLPAHADPLKIIPDAYVTSRASEANEAIERGASAAPQRYTKAAANNMGGGLIELLFGAAARPFAVAPPYQATPADYQPAPPRFYQPVLPGYQSEPAPQLQGYTPAAAGDMTHPPVDPKYDRQVVGYAGDERAGTIIIDTPNRFLYLVQEGRRALRYGIGVGRPGFTWAGVKAISEKREWPDWRPPDDMLRRRPDLPHYMAGGPGNPLGARALYLGSTLYRIHGSNEPWTIGTQVSSGCIRMRNDDVTDLYDRVKVGTKVIVI